MNIRGSEKKKKRNKKRKEKKGLFTGSGEARDDVRMKSFSALKYNIIHCAVDSNER